MRVVLTRALQGHPRLPKVAQDCHLANLDEVLEILLFSTQECQLSQECHSHTPPRPDRDLNIANGRRARTHNAARRSERTAPMGAQKYIVYESSNLSRTGGGRLRIAPRA